MNLVVVVAIVMVDVVAVERYLCNCQDLVDTIPMMIAIAENFKKERKVHIERIGLQILLILVLFLMFNKGKSISSYTRNLNEQNKCKINPILNENIPKIFSQPNLGSF